MMKTFQAIRLNPWREFSILMMILMEVCWVTPWFRSLVAKTITARPFVVFCALSGMVIFAHILVRAMNYFQIKKYLRYGIWVVIIVICIVVGIKTLLYAHESMSVAELLNRPIRNFADLRTIIPAEFIVSLAVLIAFWRGLSLAQEYIGPGSVMQHFWLGIIMYVVFVFVNTLETGESPGDFFYLFLFSSLLAMCAARISVIRLLRGGRENMLNRFWVVGIIMAAALIVGLSASLEGVIGELFVRTVVVIMALLTIIMGLIWILINPLITFLVALLGNLFNTSIKIAPPGAGLQNLSKLLQGINQRMSDIVGKSGFIQFFERWGPTIKIIILIGILAIVLSGLIFWMAFKLWQDRAGQQSNDEQKTNLKLGNILQWMADLLRQRLIDGKNSLAQLTDFKSRQKLRAAARIRQVYADLMDLCESLGQPRDEAETPLEFLPQLNRLFPGQQAEAGIITKAYNYVRYGQLPETRQEVEEIEAAWKRLHSASRELSTTQKHAKKKEAYGNPHP